MTPTPLPETLNGVVVERVIKIDSSLLYLIDGALAWLVDIEPLIETGTLTVDEARILLDDMFWCYLTGDCTNDNEDNLKIILLTDNGYLFESNVIKTGDMYMGRLNNLSMGLRFQNAVVPPATELLSATLIIRPSTDNLNTPFQITVRGIAADNPPTWSNAYKPHPRTFVTPTKVITPSTWVTGTDVEIDVTTVIQAIIDRAGYSLGNAISLTLLNNSGTSGYLSIVGFDDDTVNCARLNLVY